MFDPGIGPRPRANPAPRERNRAARARETRATRCARDNPTDVRSFSHRRSRIGGPTRRSAKGGWTPAEVSFFACDRACPQHRLFPAHRRGRAGFSSRQASASRDTSSDTPTRSRRAFRRARCLDRRVSEDGISRSKHRVFEAVVQCASVEFDLRRVRRALPFRDRTLTSPTLSLTTQDDILRRAVAQYKGKNWKKIGACARLSPAETPLEGERLPSPTDSPRASWSSAPADQARAFGAVATRAEPRTRTRATPRASLRRRAPPVARPPAALHPPAPADAADPPRLFKIRSGAPQPSTSRSARTCSACTAGRRC